MIVEGLCRDCNKWFDAHWNNLPKSWKIGDTIRCPVCGSQKTQITTDEHYSEFTREDEPSEYFL